MDDIFTWIGLAIIGLTSAGVLWQDRERFMRPSVQVQGEVIGHHESVSDGDDVYAAIYRFTADGVEHESVDSFYTATKRQAVGTIRELRFPQGRPDLARPPRTAFWAMVYALLAGMAALLAAKLLGRIA